MCIGLRTKQKGGSTTSGPAIGPRPVPSDQGMKLPNKEHKKKTTGSQTCGEVIHKPEQHPPYDPIEYENGEKNFILDRERKVTHVHFIAQTVLQTGGNHWVMYLQVGPN